MQERERARDAGQAVPLPLQSSALDEGFNIAMHLQNVVGFSSFSQE